MGRKVDLGRAESIRGPYSLGEKLTRSVNNALSRQQNLMENPEGMMGAAGGGLGMASIRQLANSAEAETWPALKKALDWIVKNMPKEAELGPNSRFVSRSELAFPDSLGEANPLTGEIRIMYDPLTSSKSRRSLEEMMDTVGHEHMGHEALRTEALKGGKESYQKFKDSTRSYNKMKWEDRPDEIYSREQGARLKSTLKNEGVIPLGLMDKLKKMFGGKL